MAKRKQVVIALICLTLMNSALIAEGDISIAVLPLEGSGIESSEAQVLTDELRSVLVQSGQFVVLERSNMESILKEQGFQLSGCTSAECALEAGKLLGVSKMVAGSVGKLGELFNISIRMFDVETGQIEKTVSRKHEGSVEELLNVIIRLGNDLSGVQQDRIIAGGQYDLLPSPNRFGLWIGLYMPRTSLLSEVGKGLGAGVFYKVHLFSNLFIQPQISYHTSELDYYEPTDILQFEYLDLALLFSYEISSLNIKDFILSLNAGMAFNSVLAAQEEYEGYVSDVKSEVRDNTLSLNFGIGLGIRLGKIIITIEPRYERGLSTIFKDDLSWEVGKRQAFSFIACVSF
jgi:TolB-like protein